MKVADNFAPRVFAVEAMASLERQLQALLDVATALANAGNSLASAELRRALGRSLRALRVVQNDLTTIQVIETVSGFWRSPS